MADNLQIQIYNLHPFLNPLPTGKPERTLKANFQDQKLRFQPVLWMTHSRVGPHAYQSGDFTSLRCQLEQQGYKACAYVLPCDSLLMTKKTFR